MRVMKQVLIYITLFINFATNSFAQQLSTQYNFANPLSIPLILSGTFGELRSNHFHTGIDIKTGGKEGLSVKSIYNGYISRVSVSPSGYGKAIYIVHPNGLTSVYAHLQKFSSKIERLISKYQYAQKKYKVNFYPKRWELPINKNEIIGKSGNSGGSGGPHLHFEIRDTKTQEPKNPMLYNYYIKDSKPPSVRGVYIYDIGQNLKTHKELIPNSIKLFFDKDLKQFFTNEIKVKEGYIAFGLNAVDKLNFAKNSNGVYSVKLFVNDKLLLQYKMDKLSFYEQRYINSFIDYKYYVERKRRIQKLFLDPGNKLSIYNSVSNDGYLYVNAGEEYFVKIEVKDYVGNTSIVNIDVFGEGKRTEEYKNNKSILFDYKMENSFETNNFKLTIPKGALYRNISFDYSFKNGIYNIGDYDIPLYKKCKISFKIDEETDSLIQKIVVVNISKSNEITSLGGIIKDGYITARTNNLGKYTTLFDLNPPVITPVNISPKKYMKKEKYLSIKIKDELSGIKKYNGYIDGEWVLFEYDEKNDLLKYDLKDVKLLGNEHVLELVVEDNVDNISTYKVVFYR